MRKTQTYQIGQGVRVIDADVTGFVTQGPIESAHGAQSYMVQTTNGHVVSRPRHMRPATLLEVTELTSFNIGHVIKRDKLAVKWPES